jgi:hypothetical protein
MAHEATLQELGRINGYRIVVAVPDTGNGRKGFIDMYAVVGVRDSDGEAVSAWATGPNAATWCNGVFFLHESAAENVERATRYAIERAGHRLAGE